MKNNLRYIAIIALGILVSMSGCKKDSVTPVAATYAQEDQFGRPAINTVFNDAAHKDAFNVTIPSAQSTIFGPMFKTALLALNTGYTTNLLGLSADQFVGVGGVLSTDVMSVSLTGKTTFYDGTNVLTGRALADDVIDVELTLIFGGPTGASNPTLTSDHVDANDHAFLTTFPYLAAAN